MVSLPQFNVSEQYQHMDTVVRAAAEELLKTETISSVATISPSTKPYIHTAYYVWNLHDCLYFLSETSTQHAENVSNTPDVAVNIFHHPDRWGDSIAGIQLLGHCTILDKNASEALLPLYIAKFPHASQVLRHGLRDDFADSRLFQVSIQTIKLVHEKRLGEELYVELHRRQ